MDTRYNLSLFQQMVSCNYAVHFATYDSELNLLESKTEDDLLFDGLLSLTGYKDKLLSEPNTFNVPVLLDSPLGLNWVVDFECDGQKPLFFHVMGPVFIYENSARLIERELDKHQLSVSTKFKFIQTLHAVPLMPTTIFFQYATMFHYCLTGQKCPFLDFQRFSNKPKEPLSDSSPENKAELNPNHLGAYQMETKLMRIIENGCLDYQSVRAESAYVSTGIKANLSDHMRQMKYSSATLLTLASRAAIRGGLPAATAYSLNDTYLEQIDNCKTSNELVDLTNLFYHDFVQRVHDIKQQPQISRPIQTCADYISMHVTEKLDVSTLSALVGYSDCYLSRKFKNEIGVNLKQYILTAKMEYAKVQLASTNHSISDIGVSLGFNSRSHFSDTFTRQVGMSPQQYKDAHGRS